MPKSRPFAVFLPDFDLGQISGSPRRPAHSHEGTSHLHGHQGNTVDHFVEKQSNTATAMGLKVPKSCHFAVFLPIFNLNKIWRGPPRPAHPLHGTRHRERHQGNTVHYFEATGSNFVAATGLKMPKSRHVAAFLPDFGLHKVPCGPPWPTHPLVCWKGSI